ncbi:YraN family protein [Yoonia sp. SS1-5]|uniref:YraN family protein n=1 Tax=Yoonia rhodophyticola TaxID=3137370 RepID=A0AAN0NIK6_9RHOB
MTGSVGYHAGLRAEDIVVRHYRAAGASVAATRWRGAAGEIDLVMQANDVTIFVEVKKSRSFAQAAHRLGPRQIARICAAGAEFLAGQPLGQLTETRFDLALVDGQGAVKVIENAFMAA